MAHGHMVQVRTAKCIASHCDWITTVQLDYNRKERNRAQVKFYLDCTHFLKLPFYLLIIPFSGEKSGGQKKKKKSSRHCTLCGFGRFLPIEKELKRHRTEPQGSRDGVKFQSTPGGRHTLHFGMPGLSWRCRLKVLQEADGTLRYTGATRTLRQAWGSMSLVPNSQRFRFSVRVVVLLKKPHTVAALSGYSANLEQKGKRSGEGGIKHRRLFE